ncbi:diaminopimelate decarboxylase [Cognaticolwellia beringensis]|uniref:Diaminopimelate decarboxylase n=1 Tax=Cognaticolwellia beringensis TaxID=1967665 RepID=A0A222G7E5_9GAMM|nr:diaminopimelate decarboxylase [Cognaticolwellia beringensis]ASP47808.1 diaminopimelate decarboxylase [Cognaticolwellia beringensis]
MDFFNRKQHSLFAEQCPVAELAKQYGTPLYIYSRATIERHWHAFDQAAGERPHLVCYAVKANSNIAVLNVMARLGSGFDIVSKGELMRVIEAGGDPKKVVFSGVGKTSEEIAFALNLGIYCFNVESAAELERIQSVAQGLNKVAPISLRVNPDVDAGTHPYISTGLKENKFGISIEQAPELYQYASTLSHINIQGVDCHIGSQLTEILPFLDALDRVLKLVDELAEQGIALSHIDVGGGLGVCYDDEQPPHPKEYAEAIAQKLTGRDLTLIYEPGRAVMANAGILVTEVEYIKVSEDRNFAIVDAAMNDLIRPALYQAWQAIIPVEQRDDVASAQYDVVGPICETGDFLGKDRALAISAGDLLAIRSAGAYGFTMSSNYNSRPRAAEVMVDGSESYLVRKRETFSQLWQGESLLPL